MNIREALETVGACVTDDTRPAVAVIVVTLLSNGQPSAILLMQADGGDTEIVRECVNGSIDQFNAGQTTAAVTDTRPGTPASLYLKSREVH